MDMEEGCEPSTEQHFFNCSRRKGATLLAGIVILMLDAKMEPAVARNMVKGLPDTLHSEFRLSYSMLLNLMRGEGRMPARELLAASFKQFQVEQALPALKLKVERLQVRLLQKSLECVLGQNYRL